MNVLNLSPDCFVEVLVLGLYWEHWPPVRYRTSAGNIAYKSSWTTVDHVLKLFCNLELITVPQIKMVQDKRLGNLHQRKLLRHCGSIYGSTQVINNDSWFLYHQGAAVRGRAIDPLRLVRDVHIELLEGSIPRAMSLEEKYTKMLVKDVYLAEARRVKEMFRTEAATASASSQYRSRVQSDLSRQKDEN